MNDEYDDLVTAVHELYKQGYIINTNPGPSGFPKNIPDDSDWDFDFDDNEDGEFPTPVDPNQVFTHEQAEELADGTLLVDADGYAFQRRRGEWFMAGAAHGSTEFSGAFPARIAVLKTA